MENLACGEIQGLPKITQLLTKKGSWDLNLSAGALLSFVFTPPGSALTLFSAHTGASGQHHSEGDTPGLHRSWGWVHGF